MTSVPFGWVDWTIINSLRDSDGPGAAAFAHNMVIARAVKPVRALKLVRLLRASSMWGLEEGNEGERYKLGIRGKLD